MGAMIQQAATPHVRARDRSDHETVPANSELATVATLNALGRALGHDVVGPRAAALAATARSIPRLRDLISPIVTANGCLSWSFIVLPLPKNLAWKRAGPGNSRKLFG